MVRHLLICLTITTLISFASSIAGIIYVPNDTTSIQGGIHLAGNGDTVLIDDGTYYENINFKGKAITVASMFIMDGDTNHINNTIIDGSQPSNPDSGSVVYFVSGEDTTSIIYGFTITGGTGTDYFGLRFGGGIYTEESSACILKNDITLNSCYSSNYDARGGGISSYAHSAANRYILIRNNNIVNN